MRARETIGNHDGDIQCPLCRIVCLVRENQLQNRDHQQREAASAKLRLSCPRSKISIVRPDLKKRLTVRALSLALTFDR